MASPTSTFVDPNLPAISVFSQFGINERQVEKRVALMNPAFDVSVMAKISEHLGKPEMIEAATRVIEVYRKPLSWAASYVGTRTVSGSNLVITYTQSDFQAIRERHMVFCGSSKAIGYVISKGAGTATISFLNNPNGNASFVSADFAQGTLVSDGGEITNPNNRQSSETLYTMPIRYQNIVGSTSDTCTMTAEQAKQMTYVINEKGTQYYAQKFLSEMLARFRQEHSVRDLRDIPVNLDSTKPVGASIINQIKTMGGRSRAILAAVDETEFNAVAEDYANNGGNSSKEVVIVGGYSYIRDLQVNVFKGLLNTAGKGSVLGEIEGLNCMGYWLAGFHYILILDPLYQNPNIFPQSTIFPGSTTMSKSAIWFDPTPVPTEGGGQMPCLQDYYYLQSDMMVVELPGMTNMQGNPNKTGFSPKLESAVEVNWNTTRQLTNPGAGYWHYTSN